MGKRQSRRRRKRSERGAPDRDAIAEWRDWTEHPYVPGYYLGGRIPPFLRRRNGRNPYGYVLAVTGSATLVFAVVILLAGGSPSSGTIVALAIAGLQFVAGWRLAR